MKEPRTRTISERRANRRPVSPGRSPFAVHLSPLTSHLSPLTNSPTRRPADPPTRRPADTPIRRYADTPTRFHSGPLEKASGDRSDKTEGQAQIAGMSIIEDNRNRPPHEHLEDLAGSEEVVKIQISTFLRVIQCSCRTQKSRGFPGYSSSSSVFPGGRSFGLANR